MNPLENFYWHLKTAQISDIDYPIKGTYILLPYGTKIMGNIFNKIIKEFEKEGYEKVDLPEIIPDSFVKDLKILDIFKTKNPHGSFNLAYGFESQSAYLAKCLIKSKKDFPLRIFNLGKVRRQDTKRAMIKNMEYTVCEFNSFFINKDEAIKELKKVNNIIAKLLNTLNLSFIKVKDNSDQYKFYVYFPFSNNFGSLFCSVIQDKKYSEKFFNNNEDKPVQLNFSFTDRILSAYLCNHMDKDGFILPKGIAPYSVAIPEEEFDPSELTFLKGVLSEFNLRHISKNSKNSKNYYDWFKSSGIPLSISITKDKFSIRNRLEKDISLVSKNDLKKKIENELKKFNSEKFNSIQKKIDIGEIKGGSENYSDGVIYKLTDKNIKVNPTLKNIGITDEGDSMYLTKKY